MEYYDTLLVKWTKRIHKTDGSAEPVSFSPFRLQGGSDEDTRIAFFLRVAYNSYSYIKALPSPAFIPTRSLCLSLSFSQT